MDDLLTKHLEAAVVFSLLGIAVFALAFLLMAKLSPFSIRKEIEHDQNTALAVLMGSVILGVAHIIASAITG